jgi:hypothetical protein
MIYIAYPLFLYKDNKKKYINDQEVYINLVKQKFPNEDYLLPYSRQTRTEIAEKLKCDLKEISGQFMQDLKPIISRCHKIMLFPTKENYIGLGMYWEILIAKKFNLNVLIYNQDLEDFTNSFEIEDINNNIYGIESHIFYKKIVF